MVVPGETAKESRALVATGSIVFAFAALVACAVELPTPLAPAAPGETLSGVDISTHDASTGPLDTSPHDDVLVDMGPAPERIVDSRIAYFPFDEGSGLVAKDQSGVEPAMDLDLAPGVTWLPGLHGVAIADSVLKTPGPAKKLYDRLMASNTFTIEVWCRPASTTQDGPARIVGFSRDTVEQNFSLGQDAELLEMRLVATSTDDRGKPYLSTATVVTVARSHYVVTFDASGWLRIYVDGTKVVSEERPGTFVWDESFPFLIGNEGSLNRPWAGDILMVGIYERAFNDLEVEQNYRAGSSP